MNFEAGGSVDENLMTIHDYVALSNHWGGCDLVACQSSPPMGDC